MKAYKFIVLIFIIPLFTNSSCVKENHRFIIQNNSDKEIIIIINMYNSVVQDTTCFIQNMTHREYQNFIYHGMILPHSNKNMERSTLGEYLISHPNDTLYIGVFNRIDVDTMSCEEFEQEFPLKKEWKVTLADMQAVNWTLVYTAEEQNL